MDFRTGSRVGDGLALPLPLRLYIRAGNAAVVVGPLIVLIVLGMRAFFRARGQALAVRLRAVLVTIVAVVGGLTAMGLYTFGRASLMHAVRLSVATAAPVQVLDRDLSLLYDQLEKKQASALSARCGRLGLYGACGPGFTAHGRGGGLLGAPRPRH